MAFSACYSDVEMALSPLIIMPCVPKDFTEVLLYSWVFYFVCYLSCPKSSRVRKWLQKCKLELWHSNSTKAATLRSRKINVSLVRALSMLFLFVWHDVSCLPHQLNHSDKTPAASHICPLTM